MKKTLKTFSSSLTLKIENGALYFENLSSPDGQNLIKTAPAALPSGYDWRFSNIHDTKHGTAFVFEAPQAKYTLFISADPALPGPFEISGLFENLSDAEIILTPGLIFSAHHTLYNGTAWRFPKESGVAEGFERWFQNMKFPGDGIYKVPVEKTPTRAVTSTLQDFNKSDIPLIWLEGQGKGILLAMEWPSCTLKADTESLTADLDIGKGEFTTRVPAHEGLDLPNVYFGAFDGGADEAGNAFKRWFFAKKSPQILRENPREPLTQSDAIGDLKVLLETGVESVKWDYGWWHEYGSFPKVCGLEGSWALRNLNYIENLKSLNMKTMAEYGAFLREKNVNYTVYTLLHDAEADIPGALTSAGENGHPEWFSHRRIVGGRSADLGNRSCVEFLKQALREFFISNNIPTWRTDFEPICCVSDKDNNHFPGGADVQFRCAEGFYSLVDDLYKTVPGFRWENCSSGGSLKDFASFTRCVNINCDDSASLNSLRTTFYDSSFFIHPAQLQIPANLLTCLPGSPHYEGMGDIDYGFRSIILGVPMFSSWGGYEKYGLEKYVKKYNALYCERVRPLVRNGDLYHVLPRPDFINYDGVEYFDSASGRGALFLFKPSPKGGAEKTVMLKGLREDKNYRLTFEDRSAQNKTLSGETLIRDGLTVEIAEDMGSEIVWIDEDK